MISDRARLIAATATLALPTACSDDSPARSDTTALFGNHCATFPAFPAEIRAPAGTLAGVSGYQVHFAGEDIFTPADEVDLLIAFNPAALRANVHDVRPKGMVIINSDSFNKKALLRAGYTDDPLLRIHRRASS